MHATRPRLEQTDFPSITRYKLDTLQVNLGYKCNQQCVHCHVNAGPKRKEMMARETIDLVLSFLSKRRLKQLDLTGGAPELNPYFRYLVSAARRLDVQVIDRCNLTILEEPDQEDLAGFLAKQQVEVTASLPCYLEENVDQQRGKGVFEASIAALKRLNELGYGKDGSELRLNLVYNPQETYLPPPQPQLEASYKTQLLARYGIVFNRLLTLANMPIQRFGSMLISKGKFDDYMQLLRDNHSKENLDAVMCRNLLSIDWQGYVYDCDFNQMLGLPLGAGQTPTTHLSELLSTDIENKPITIADHCYGCTAGQGSSCGGALA